jgi:hypothetical protein
VDLNALGVFVVSPEWLQVFLTVEAADFAKEGVLISAKSALRVDRSPLRHRRGVPAGGLAWTIGCGEPLRGQLEACLFFNNREGIPYT